LAVAMPAVCSRLVAGSRHLLLCGAGAVAEETRLAKIPVKVPARSQSPDAARERIVVSAGRSPVMDCQEVPPGLAPHRSGRMENIAEAWVTKSVPSWLAIAVMPRGIRPGTRTHRAVAGKSRVKNILSKLQANDCTHAAMIAVKRGILLP
jgi:hypothetical protein